MKQLVKHVFAGRLLRIRHEGLGTSMTAGAATRIGIGDNTVQPDGNTVHVARDQWRRIRAAIKAGVAR